jgi:predicted nucleotidyltransferase component of viral defense system
VTKTPKNMGASVRARLLRLSTERGEDFQLLLTRYANERLLYRLARSRHADSFVLKGAALFALWTGRPHRATRDLDLLGFGEASSDRIRRIFSEILETEAADDGVHFDVPSLEVAPIRDGQEYGGFRLALAATLASARLRLQIDVGFGDAITPAAETIDFPALLDFPAPRLRAYPRETVVAEKLEAMVQLGMANSRMKDFFDIVVLSRLFDFEGDLLARAIRATFERRATALPSGPPVAFTPAFAADATKRTQWTAFLRKSGAPADPADLPTAVAAVRVFLTEPLRAASVHASWGARWTRGGPWQRG